MRKDDSLLQLFAGEAAAMEDTGVQIAADAGQPGTAREENRAQTQDAAASSAAGPQRMTWEEIKADPEYNREIQSIVRSRLQREKLHSQPAPAPETDYLGHILGLERQAEAMKTVFPGFDLRRELANPAFARMTAPDVGLSVEDAYYVLHRQEIQSAALEVTARKAAQMVSDTVRAGALRPRENGTSGEGAAVPPLDYRKASADQRAALKKRIRQAGARGEKLYPGT